MEYQKALEILENNEERKLGSRYARIKDLCKKAIRDYINTHYSYFTNEEERLFKEIEAALGFKLYVWQKTFILTGHYRRMGATTAECLKILLDKNAYPYDCSTPPKSYRERYEREELRKIQNKLSESGIPTRIIFWNNREKERYKATTGYNTTTTICDEFAHNRFEGGL